MRKDEIDHLVEPRRSRSADRPSSRRSSSSSPSSSHRSSSRKRSPSATRRLRSESVPVRQSASVSRSSRHSLSAGGVTARSTARALMMQQPLSEKRSVEASSPASSTLTSTSTSGVDLAAGGEEGEATYIPMETYDIQQNCLPILRPREPRMNGEFLRILAMELEMRRHGKLSPDFYSGKARMVLAPRSDYEHLSKKSRNWTPWTL